MSGDHGRAATPAIKRITALKRHKNFDDANLGISIREEGSRRKTQRHRVFRVRGS